MALVPSGPTSNYLAAAAGGDLALAVLMTVFGTLLSAMALPFTLAPLLAAAGLASEALAPPVTELLKGLLAMVVAPVAVGIFLAKRFPTFVRRWRPAANRVAAAVFAVLVLGALAAEWRALAGILGKALPWALALNLLAMAVGASLARALRLPARQAPVLAIKCALQNVSVALAISIVQMKRQDIAATAALYGVLQLLTAGTYAVWWRRKLGRDQGRSKAWVAGE